MAEEKSSKLDKLAGGTNSLIKGNRAWYDVGGRNYKINFPDATTTTVGIIDKTSRASQVARAQKGASEAAKFLSKSLASGNVKNIEKATRWVKSSEKALRHAQNAAPKGSYVLRLDTAHPGAMFDHVNINPNIVNAGKAAGDAKFVDPHLQLPPGGMQAGTGMATFAQYANKVNKVAVPLAIAIDTARTGYAVFNDAKKGTTRNTVTTVATIAGGWAGGYGGAMGGAAFGTALLPGVGTIIGGICGGLFGGIYGSSAGGAVVDAIGDDCGYDMEWRCCSVCEKKFKARVYIDERKCEDCQKIEASE